jgi:outer membrane protein TolC
MQLRKHWAFGGLIVCLVAPHIVVAADGPSPSLSVAASGAASTGSLESMVVRALASHPEIESLRMAQDAASAAREQGRADSQPRILLFHGRSRQSH